MCFTALTLNVASIDTTLNCARLQCLLLLILLLLLLLSLLAN